MLATLATPTKLRVADEVWIATAMLHRKYPDRKDFAVQEIIEQAASENVTGRLRQGVSVHAYSHCVANLPPNPATYRMLTSTGKSRRRLYKPGDSTHVGRTGKTRPDPGQIPEAYHELLGWYDRDYAKQEPASAYENDPILALRGVGAEIWKDEDPDEYIRKLREDWR